MAAPGWSQRDRRLRPVDESASKPRNQGWILRSDNTMAPADEEVEFHQATELDIVDVATFLQHSTAPRQAPEGVGPDILTYGKRDNLSHINLLDPTTWHP